MSPYKPKEYVDEAERWRKHAAAENWWLIDELHLSRDERKELLILLTEKVPTREWGDGLNTFEDFIHPREAISAEAANAARLARKLKKQEISEAQSPPNAFYSPFVNPFIQAVEAAKETLRKHRIKYEGLSRTYLYYHPTVQKWMGISGCRAKLIIDRSNELDPINPDNFNRDGHYLDDRSHQHKEYLKWQRRHPWRRIVSLQQMITNDHINPYTRLWHACNILEAYEKTLFWEYPQPFAQPPPLGSIFSNAEQFTNTHMCDAYRAALHIGTAYEAMKNKSIEPDAIRGIEQRKDTSEGGKARARQTAQPREEILKLMHDLMAGKGWKKYTFGPTWAALETFKRGHGASKGANLQTWNRYGQKQFPKLKWL